MNLKEQIASPGNAKSADVSLVEVKRIVDSSPGPERGSALQLSWSDGSTYVLSADQLRADCPCASCLESRGDRTHAKPLSARKSLLQVITHDRDQQLDLKEIWPIGNYALGMLWGDEHDSGIYTFKHLYSLCRQSADN